MPTQCRVCETQRKRGTKFWQVLDVVCVDDNWDPHVNKGRGKKFGDIFPAQVESNPGKQMSGSVTWPLGQFGSSFNNKAVP